MTLKIETYEVEPNNGAFEIKHGLNTLTPHLTAWQNGFLVNLSVRVLDESTVMVYNLGIGGATVVLLADVPAKTSRSKTSGTTGKSKR